MPDPHPELPMSPMPLDIQAEAIRTLALAYDHERFERKETWLGRLLPVQETLDMMRSDLIDRIGHFVSHGGDPDIAVPITREGRPPLMVPLLDFFLVDIDSLDVAMTVMQLGGTPTNSTVRKLGRLAMGTPPEQMPQLFTILLDWAVATPGLDWRQTVREEVVQPDRHVGETQIESLLQDYCPGFLLKLARVRGGDEVEMVPVRNGRHP